jgi:hypothetical protein
MNVYEEPAESEGAAAPPPPPKPDPLRELRALPTTEKLLAAAAAAVIVAYLLGGAWTRVFRSWFYACALLGALGVLALVMIQVFGIRSLSSRTRMYAFAVAGLLPAAGFVFEELSSDLSRALMLAGGVAMGLWAWQIAERESLLG